MFVLPVVEPKQRFDNEGYFSFSYMVEILCKDQSALEQFTKTEIKILLDRLGGICEIIASDDGLYQTEEGEEYAEEAYRFYASMYDFVLQSCEECGWV